MKSIVKTLMGLAAASVAAVSVLTVSALAVANEKELLKFNEQRASQGNIMTVNESVNDVGLYANSFLDSSGSTKYMDVYVNGGGNNNNTAYTTLSAYTGYKSNYKFVSLSVEDINGHSSYVTTPGEDVNKSTVKVSLNYGKVKLNYAHYYGFLYDGDESSANFLRRTQINVTKK